MPSNPVTKAPHRVHRLMSLLATTGSSESQRAGLRRRGLCEPGVGRAENPFADGPGLRDDAPMLAKVCSSAVSGVEAYPVEVEVNAGWGDTLIVIVGLPDAAVKESRDRVATALHNSGFKVPMGRTTINLAPADIKKEGPSFDLPIALGMLAASEQIGRAHV